MAKRSTEGQAEAEVTARTEREQFIPAQAPVRSDGTERKSTVTLTHPTLKRDIEVKPRSVKVWTRKVEDGGPGWVEK